MSDYGELLATLPEDWKVLPIEEIGEVISGGTPSRGNSRYWKGSIPWVTPGEVTNIGSKYLRKTEEQISAEGLSQSGARLLPANSLLVTTRASLGAAVLNAAPATTNQGFKSIAFKDTFSPGYYFHWSRKLKPELERRASGTTFLEISGSQFRVIQVPVPPYEEQQTIAHVLDTLDIQIQRTEALIAKLEKVKEGLLHDLLTCGIDEYGRLRPSPEQAPELYKESPLGLIPREWSISSVGREFEIQLGKMLDAERNSGQMKPYLGNKAVQWGVIDIREVGQVRLTDSDVIKFRLVPGDLLVCEGGEIGRAALWEGQMDECYYQKALHRLRSKNNLSPRFMLQVLFLWGKRSTLSDYASQTSIAHLPKEKLEIVPVPVPSKHEQESIINVLQSHERTLKAESEALSEMHKIKSGLMDDLLTGRVRVTPLLDQAQATTPA
jgi:type I restriction enzyme S subunit